MYHLSQYEYEERGLIMSEKIYEDEISLKELILILLNNWRIIIGATISGTLLAIVVSFCNVSRV